MEEKKNAEGKRKKVYEEDLFCFLGGRRSEKEKDENYHGFQHCSLTCTSAYALIVDWDEVARPGSFLLLAIFGPPIDLFQG